MTRGGPPAWGLGEALTTAHHKNVSFYKHSQRKPPTWMDLLV